MKAIINRVVYNTETATEIADQRVMVVGLVAKSSHSIKKK